MKVRGAVLREIGLPAPYHDSRPLIVEDLELDDPGPDELLIRVRAAGLCHSDLSVIDGSRPRAMPMVLGHEGAGEVVAIGTNVRDFAVGDHVALAFVPGCGRCIPCLSGRAALCEPAAVANTAGTLLGGDRRWHNGLNHHLGVSAFAEQIVVSSHSAVKIDADIPFAVAALFGCAVLTGVGAALNAARIRPDERVAIFGLGGVGLATLLGTVLSGASTIAVVDVVPEKLELARELGATHAIRAGGDAIEAVREATRGGADKVIETVGNAQVLADAYAATRRGGTTVTVGLPAPSQMLSVPAVSLVAEERTLRGSYLGSCVPKRDIPRFVGMYQAGRLPVDRLLTHTLGLDDINAAFDRLAAGEGVRHALII